MKKIQLTFANEIQEAQTLIISIKKNGVASSLQEIFIEDASGAGQAERWDYGIHGNTGVYDYLANNFRTAFNRDYNTVNFNNGLTFTRVGNILNLTSTDESVIFTNASGSAIDSGAVTFVLSEPTAPPELSKRLKYWFEFKDVKEVTHRVEISEKVVGSDYVKRVLDDGGIIESSACVDAFFNSGSVQIYGSCSLEYSETKDTLESVRGSGLKIDLDANSDLTFSDLYSEEERTYSVEYFRDGVTLFNGWLSPEGIYQSLVSDKWVISLDCTDGLGFLKNLSYVEDATGLNFVGKQSLTKIVSNCLKRTKTPQNILTSVNIYYDGLSQTLDVFDNVYFNANRFVKDDEKTIMNCDEVLRSVLEPFGAVITSYKGEWLIYKPNSLVSNSEQVFFAYDNSGVALGTPSRTIDFNLDLGSQINNYYPHHVNANQQKTIKSSIGAYRINYKYGLVASLLLNEDLIINNGSLTDYTILNSNGVTLNSDRGFVINKSQTSAFDVLETIGNTVAFGTNLLSTIIHKTNSTEVTSIKLRIELNDNGTIYYYTGASWVSNSSVIAFRSNSVETISEINIAQAPVDGVIKIVILTNNVFVPPGETPPNANQLVEYISISLSPREQKLLKGENHTFQRVLNPSSKIAKTKEIFNADNPSEVYVGTIYKADETTPTETWTRFGASETKAILEIMGEERMKMYGKPLQVYSGDIYGYFNYLSLVTINNLTGVFMPTSYNYNALENITSLKLIEVLNTDILDDIDYKVTLDYGNVVEPTITG